MEYFHSFDFKFQWKFYRNCATRFWQSSIYFPLTCLAKRCGLQGGLAVLGLHLSRQWARASPLTPSTDSPSALAGGPGELGVAEFPSVEFSLGAVVTRLSTLPWHIVLSSTILEKNQTWF